MEAPQPVGSYRELRSAPFTLSNVPSMKMETPFPTYRRTNNFELPTNICDKQSYKNYFNQARDLELRLDKVFNDIFDSIEKRSDTNILAKLEQFGNNLSTKWKFSNIQKDIGQIIGRLYQKNELELPYARDLTEEQNADVLIDILRISNKVRIVEKVLSSLTKNEELSKQIVQEEYSELAPTDLETLYIKHDRIIETNYDYYNAVDAFKQTMERIEATTAEYYLFGKTVEICPYLTLNQKQKIYLNIGYWPLRGCVIQKEQLPVLRWRFKIIRDASYSFLRLFGATAFSFRVKDLFIDINRTLDELEKFIDKHGSSALEPKGFIHSAFKEGLQRIEDSKAIKTFDSYDEALDEQNPVADVENKSL